MKEKVGKVLKELRKRAGFSQKEVYEKLGIKQSTFSSWERGVSEPNAETLLELCKLYGVKDIFREFGYDGYADDGKISLNIFEYDLIENYRSMSDFDKRTVDMLVKRMVESKGNDEVLILPMTTLMKSEKPEEPEEEEYIDLDYFPMAAGMGTGYYVDNPLRESIRCPISAIPDHTDFVILAEGNSMEPMFSSGDKLFIQSTPSLQIGEIGLFNYQGNEMVKRLGNGQLESINEEYEPIKILYPDEFYVQGKVLGKMES